MTPKLSILILIIVLHASYFSVSAQQTTKPTKRARQADQRCKGNPDPSYARSRVLEDLATILNQSIPENAAAGEGFYSNSESGIGFFVVDLTNPSNKNVTLRDCVDFIDGHVYHVAPSDAHYSLSHIVVLEDGKLKVFRSVNCPGRGDRLEDVINYVSVKLVNNKRRDEILNRVRNYRKYGVYGALAHAISICNKR